MGESWVLLPKKLLMSMLRNQISFGLEEYQRVNTPTERTMIHWCDENCNGLYRINDAFAFFEKESDMIAFKIYWAGQKEIEGQMALIYRGITIEDRKHEVILPLKKFEGQETEILTWCYENFGNRDDNGLWDFWDDAREVVYFKFLKETDAMAFRLMWT